MVRERGWFENDVSCEMNLVGKKVRELSWSGNENVLGIKLVEERSWSGYEVGQVTKLFRE